MPSLLRRAFEHETEVGRSTASAALLKSFPPTRRWYYGKMRNAYLGSRLPPLLERIDKESRDVKLLSHPDFGLNRRVFSWFLRGDLDIAWEADRTRLLREIVIQLRNGAPAYGPQSGLPFSRYDFDTKNRLHEELAKLNADFGSLSLNSIHDLHAIVLHTPGEMVWRWSTGMAHPSPALNTYCRHEAVLKTCMSLTIELKKELPPKVQLSEWDTMVKHYRSISTLLSGAPYNPKHESA
jgi:hypothetical protein